MLLELIPVVELDFGLNAKSATETNEQNDDKRNHDEQSRDETIWPSRGAVFSFDVSLLFSLEFSQGREVLDDKLKLITRRDNTFLKC